MENGGPFFLFLLLVRQIVLILPEWEGRRSKLGWLVPHTVSAVVFFLSQLSIAPTVSSGPFASWPDWARIGALPVSEIKKFRQTKEFEIFH